ncbi:MAG: aspartate aminotransferase family protein [Gordonibacter sp.]|nr:aspartate aminotransferase family protein [Gordonibacter sp.]
MSLGQQQELESTYVMHTFGRKPVELVRGRGMTVEDDQGNTYLDFIGGIGVISLGHCHPSVVEAIRTQAARLMHVSNYYYVEGRGELARQLSDLLNHGDSSDAMPWQSFFANSGAEANECAIKLARLHARKQALARAIADGADDAAVQTAALRAPRVIVTFDRSFHGRTMATLAATAQPAKQESFQPLPDGFTHTPLNDVEALEALFSQRGEEICAIMVECVQGEGGVHPCTPAFLRAARQLTKEHGALLICDEVQTGVFRCGTPFAFQRFGIVPDVVTIAKGVASGMPTGMCAARADVAASYQPGDHGSTFGGSCLAVAAAQATLRTLVDEGFSDHVECVGVYLRERLAELPHVRQVRGLGLMVAADLDETLDANEVVARGLAAGLLLNATGPHTLRFLPPLVCQKADVDTLVERLCCILG